MENTATSSAAELPPFTGLAERVIRRVFVRRWLEALCRSAGFVLAGGLVLFVALRLAGYRWADFAGALVLIAGWIAACGAWAWWRRPQRFNAMAHWDESAGRHDEFASALFFEEKGKTAGEALHEGELLHLERTTSRLDVAAAGLQEDLPLPPVKWQWAVPLLLAAFTLSPLLRPALDAGDRKLSDDMIAKAQEEADRLVPEQGEFDQMASLSKEEKEIEKLEQDIDQTAEELRNAAGKTTREVLEDLEQRARAAEKLAERLGDRGDAWASEEMLRAMSEQADTADLAAALEDRKAEPAADEAEQLTDKFDDPKLSNEAEGRLSKALASTMEKAQTEDHKRPVGKHFGAATDDMKRKQPADAAGEFRKLAQHFRRLAERKRAEEELRKLAEKLRESGSNIAGKGAGSMQKLAGNKAGANSQNQNPSQTNMPNMSPMNSQNMQQQQGMGQGMKSMPIPGMKSMPQGMKGQGKGMAMAPVPGTMKPGKPMGMIPGQPGGKPTAMIMAPIPGTGMMPGAGAMQGGNQAGQGTAPLTPANSAAMQAQQNGLVNAQQGSEGESFMRAVEGGQRQEQAGREATAEIVEFLKVEEEALDEKSLPLSRREHVLRYFTALRERFENSESE